MKGRYAYSSTVCVQCTQALSGSYQNTVVCGEGLNPSNQLANITSIGQQFKKSKHFEAASEKQVCNPLFCLVNHIFLVTLSFQTMVLKSLLSLEKAIFGITVNESRVSELVYTVKKRLFNVCPSINYIIKIFKSFVLFSVLYTVLFFKKICQ